MFCVWMKRGDTIFRSYLVPALLILTFMSGCGVSFKSRSDKIQEDKVYIFGQACHDVQAEAEKLAVEDLVRFSGLAMLKDYHTLKRVHGDKPFCYQAEVRRVEWKGYEKALQKDKETLQTLLRDLNNTIYYSEKPEVIDEILLQRHTFNTLLTESQKIAPLSLSSCDLNRSKVAASLNARPSVKMDYMPCLRRSNFKCRLGFVSKVKDESAAVRYAWDFGDGTHSQHRNPLYTYKREGDYNVTLRVEDPVGAYSIVSTVIKVKALKKPFALFKTKRDRYKQGESIIFENRSFTQKGKLTSYKWRFGDGKHSFKKNPRHHYIAPGRYDVVLKVCNSVGSCSVASKRLTILKDETRVAVEKGTSVKAYMAEHGQPDAEIVKENALMSAYRYDGIWLLAKRGKIECAVKEKGLVTNLLGQPKKCYWHEKHAKQYMVKLK